MSLDVSLVNTIPITMIDGSVKVELYEIFTKNITHNLNKMAEAVGLYEALWSPEEIGIYKAEQLIPILKKGLMDLKANRTKYEAYNPENGWGSYESLLKFIEGYLEACKTYPELIISIDK